MSYYFTKLNEGTKEDKIKSSGRIGYLMKTLSRLGLLVYATTHQGRTTIAAKASSKKQNR